MRLHTIGDCHADSGWWNIKPEDTQFEEILHNGISYTMTDVGIRKLDAIDLSGFYPRGNAIPKWDRWGEEFMRKFNKDLVYPYNHYFNIEDGDTVIFCFGEIDCRIIFSAPEYSDIWQEMVDTTVPLYFDVIRINEEKFNRLHMMVFNIIPTTKNKYLETYPKSSGSKQRKAVTLYVNAKLREYCEKYNYIFFDIYDKYCDENGYLDRKWADDRTHILDPVYYVEFLNKLKF
jgi:hypothetical protein